jgi:hypothetical protein
MPQWPEDDNPLATQQIAYEKWRDKGAKTVKEWAIEWDITPQSAGARMRFLSAAGEAKLVFSCRTEKYGKATNLWTTTGRRILSSVPLPNTQTVYQYADTLKISLHNARCRINRMVAAGMKSVGRMRSNIGNITYLYPNDLRAWEQKVGLVGRLNEFPQDGFTVKAAAKLWDISIKTTEKRIWRLVNKSLVEKCGNLNSRLGSTKYTRSTMVYRFTNSRNSGGKKK